MGGFGTIHGSGFSDADSEILGQKSDDNRSSDIAKIRIPGVTPERGFYYRFRRLDLPPIIVYY